MKDATREDGRKMVAHYAGQGLKSRSIRKRLMWLTAAVNLAIDEGHLKFNPFSGVIPKTNDSERRLPFDEADGMVASLPEIAKIREIGEVRMV